MPLTKEEYEKMSLNEKIYSFREFAKETVTNNF